MNVCCVVRSVGERTAEACRSLLAEAVGPDQVVTVGHAPFPETLAASLRAGVAAGRKWTLTVDADVLPLDGAVRALVDEAEQLDESAIEIQPLIFDRFFGGWRPSGGHLYRTSLLPYALDVLGTLPTAIRPESALLYALEARGLAWRQSVLQFGLHDFEQAPADVYRKCFLHARKHAEHGPAFERYWRARVDAPDFAVALQGFAAGLAHRGPVELDTTAPYLMWPGHDAPTPLSRLTSRDVSRMADAEEAAIAALPSTVAPVWDWIASVWRTTQGRTLDAFVRALVRADLGPYVIEGVDARTQVLVQVMAAWGIRVASPPVAHASSVIRVSDGRFVAHVNGRTIVEPAPGEVPDTPTTPAPHRAVDALVRDLSVADVTQALIYGAGKIGASVATAIGDRCRVLGFIESVATRQTPLTTAPVLDPEQALIGNDNADVIIASLGSADTMVKRLLQAARTTNRWPRRIWLLDAA